MCCEHCECKPWPRDLRDCTCPTMWNAIIPPPDCPVHGKATRLDVTCLRPVL